MERKKIRQRVAIRNQKGEEMRRVYGVANDWYKYRYNVMKRELSYWCKANNIEYAEE
jgi:hypothetical protein